MPTTSSRGDGIAWMRGFLGEDATAPIRHPEIVSGFDARTLGLKLPRAEKAPPPRPSFRRSGCPMGCNFCTTSAFFGGKGKYHQFLQHRRRAVRRDVGDGGEARGEVVLHDGRELPAAPAARHSTARTDAPARQELGVLRLLLGQRDSEVHHARTGGTRSVMGLDGSGIAAGRPMPSCTAPTRVSSPASCGSTAFACWVRPSSGWSTTRRRTSATRSSTPSATTPTFTSSCSTRRCRARRSIAR